MTDEEAAAARAEGYVLAELLYDAWLNIRSQEKDISIPSDIAFLDDDMPHGTLHMK
jgi:hypothetical protein